MFSMDARTRRRFAVLGAVVALALAILGCSATTGTGTTGGGGTTVGGGTTGGGSTATPSTAHYALAWVQVDTSNNAQVWARINGGAAQQITHRTGTNNCGRNPDWSIPVFSPDLHHIVMAFGDVGNCDQAPQAGQLFVIDVSSGALTQINSNGIELDRREEGWIDNNTIWWDDQAGAKEQALGGSPTAISSVPPIDLGAPVSAPDLVLRGHTLFYVAKTPSSGSISYALQRYDLTTHTVLAGSASLGHSCNCAADSIVGSPGFDVSADGSHIVFQRITAGGSGSTTGVGSSQFFYANADGSGATQIASYTSAASFTNMQLSPDGHLVAVTNAVPSPTVFTASVSSAGLKGDPNLHFYTQDSSSFPVWDLDSGHFWTSTSNLLYFTVGTATGTVAVSGANTPWLTIGS